MNKLLRRTAITTLCTTLLFWTAAGAASAADAKKPEATTTIKCEAASSNKEDPQRYDGPSASYMYDERFTWGPQLQYSELVQFTPQGLAYWKNWYDKDDLLLATAYDSGTKHAIIVGLDPKRNDKSATVGVVSLDADHAGGIAIYGDWLYVSDGPHTIKTFRVSDLRKAMKESKDSSLQKTPKINPVKVTRGLYGTSFLTVDSGRHQLYAGLFNEHGRDWMYRYTIGDDGSLSLDRKENGRGWRWEIPARTQGVTLTDKHFIFSSSHGRDKRSNLYVTHRRETNLDKASARCFRAPSMAEGLATDGKNAYLLFESGSYEYNGHHGKRARNVIEGVQKAELGSLTSLPGGKIHLGTLHSLNQQDGRGNDEIVIKVEDQKLGKTVQINDGDKKKIDKTVQFTGKVSVKLYEKDPKGDEYLGEQTLEPGDKDGIMDFKKHGAHYRLSYKIT